MKKVSVIMGSKSDLKSIQYTLDLLNELSIEFEAMVVSAHRTPLAMVDFATHAKERGIEVIIAGAGGAAHLPGMVAAMTILPVIGVPIESKSLKGLDSLLSIVQMPAGVPVACVAIGDAGAKNAALLAAQILAVHDEEIEKILLSYREQQTSTVLEDRMITS